MSERPNTEPNTRSAGVRGGGDVLRVAFHAINGVGLGHLVRTLCLIDEMRVLVPEIAILVVTNAADTSMLTTAGVDFVQMPPRLAEPHADPLRARTSLPAVLEEAALNATFEAFAPHLVVFDTHAPLNVVRHLASINARAVLVQRELRAESLASFARKGAALLFDRIVIPHDPGEVDLTPLADFPISLVGPIVRVAPATKKAAEAAMAVAATAAGASSASSTGSTDIRILAMAGGGGQPLDAKKYLRAVADAHVLVRARFPTLETTLVTGPYASAPNNSATFAGLTVIKSTSHDHLASLIASASLVVSQAGYNAIAEIRSLAKPAVLVPGHRKAEDQKARALRLVRAGAAKIARPEARSLADCIESILASPSKLDEMRDAHRTNIPLIAKNREAALAVLSPIWRPTTTTTTTHPIKRVVLVAHDFAPKLGGMETVARSLASSLATKGIDVRVYTTHRLGATSSTNSCSTSSGLAGSTSVVPLFTPRPPPCRIDLEADLEATLEAALCDQPDVIHLCHAGLGPWIPTLRAAFPGTIVTINVHGNDLLAPWVYPGESVTTEQYLAAQVDGLAHADAVLCVSSFSRDLAKAKGVPENVLITIENGVDVSRFQNEREQDQQQEILLTVSRLVPRKGHRTVLHAIAKLAKDRPHLKYVFTGASDVMRAELMELRIQP